MIKTLVCWSVGLLVFLLAAGVCYHIGTLAGNALVSGLFGRI